MKKRDLENFPTSESARRMLGYVSEGFYEESYVGKWLYQVMGLEYDAALAAVIDLPSQFFPETATWGLLYHEIKWGLPVRADLQYEERRKLIYQKRDLRAPMSPYRIEKYLADATDWRVFVADCNDPGEYGGVFSHPNVFKVTFMGEGTLEAEKVRNLLNRIKQSHTTYAISDRIISVLPVSVKQRVTAFRFLTGFYPLFNLPYLKLNNRWKLDGRRKLSGYDRENVLDLHPVRIRLYTGGAEAEKAFRETAERLLVRDCVRQHPESRETTKQRCSAERRADLGERVKVQAQAAEAAGARGIQMYNKNRLDGKWKLSGKRKLNGGIYQF